MFFKLKPVRERVEINAKYIGSDGRQQSFHTLVIPHNHCRAKGDTVQPLYQIHLTIRVGKESYIGT